MEHGETYIRISRDVRWLGKIHVEVKYMDIPGYSRNNKIWIIEYIADGNKIDEVNETEDDGTYLEKENLNKKINHKLRKLRTSYNQTIYNISEILLMGGTDEYYKSPIKFKEAWNDPNWEMKNNWKNAIKKEYKNMEKKDICNKCDINEKPEIQRLLGSEWVFKIFRPD